MTAARGHHRAPHNRGHLSPNTDDLTTPLPHRTAHAAHRTSEATTPTATRTAPLRRPVFASVLASTSTQVTARLRARRTTSQPSARSLLARSSQACTITAAHQHRDTPIPRNQSPDQEGIETVGESATLLVVPRNQSSDQEGIETRPEHRVDALVVARNQSPDQPDQEGIETVSGP